MLLWQTLCIFFLSLSIPSFAVHFPFYTASPQIFDGVSLFFLSLLIVFDCAIATSTIGDSQQTNKHTRKQYFPSTFIQWISLSVRKHHSSGIVAINWISEWWLNVDDCTFYALRCVPPNKSPKLADLWNRFYLENATLNIGFMHRMSPESSIKFWVILFLVERTNSKTNKTAMLKYKFQRTLSSEIYAHQESTTTNNKKPMMCGKRSD